MALVLHAGCDHEDPLGFMLEGNVQTSPTVTTTAINRMAMIFENWRSASPDKFL